MKPRLTEVKSSEAMHRLSVGTKSKCLYMGYSFRLTATVLLYAPSHRQDCTYHSLCYTVVECWLEWEIAQWVHPMKDRSDDPSHHERMLYHGTTSPSKKLVISRTCRSVLQATQCGGGQSGQKLLFCSFSQIGHSLTFFSFSFTVMFKYIKIALLVTSASIW